ncbi:MULTISPECIES: hypothetical protein [unclassified Moorena]|uniref:hypothetical protein n=1 Tax=unclassified Moorena TaxID=2683338 RepID=UPI0013FFB8EF|nr:MULTISPECIES: hypothetical protein [unclassified Moorena]NEO11801.1 hypothetical protein [Moorena sp. SIO3E8]NEP98217.1 hypothetical protein [Moorena sp. SIO3F7]
MSDCIKKGGLSLPSGHFYFKVKQWRVSLPVAPRPKATLRERIFSLYPYFTNTLARK